MFQVLESTIPTGKRHVGVGEYIGPDMWGFRGFKVTVQLVLSIQRAIWSGCGPSVFTIRLSIWLHPRLDFR